MSFSSKNADGYPPDWASGWGEDRYGVFVEFTLDDVVQRLRWIPPGRFVMGSPEDEPGRWNAESPQHEVSLAQGFWLFDTPCTQALRQAVMSENPSEFKSPQRPVEKVSWGDAKKFIDRINERVPDLELVLPSEAQWEYACRAATQTVLYSGAIDIRGERNAPALDPIAWYGGNSGVDFELPDGWDSSEWQEKQYPHQKAGTRWVGLKRPNPWGLYDMLGNVWEWVEDDWHDSYQGASVDGSAWIEAERAARRVFRGGSWRVRARNARSAYRSGGGPDGHDDGLGFRCARVQA